MSYVKSRKNFEVGGEFFYYFTVCKKKHTANLILCRVLKKHTANLILCRVLKKHTANICLYRVPKYALPCTTCLPCVYLQTLGKVTFCCVPEKLHTANSLAHGKCRVSRSETRTCVMVQIMQLASCRLNGPTQVADRSSPTLARNARDNSSQLKVTNNNQHEREKKNYNWWSKILHLRILGAGNASFRYGPRTTYRDQGVMIRMYHQTLTP